MFNFCSIQVFALLKCFQKYLIRLSYENIKKSTRKLKSLILHIKKLKVYYPSKIFSKIFLIRFLFDNLNHLNEYIFMYF